MFFFYHYYFYQYYYIVTIFDLITAPTEMSKQPDCQRNQIFL